AVTVPLGSEGDFPWGLPGKDIRFLHHPGFLADERAAPVEVVPAQHDFVRADAQAWLVLDRARRGRADLVHGPKTAGIPRVRHSQIDPAAERRGREGQRRREPPSGPEVVLHPRITDE